MPPRQARHAIAAVLGVREGFEARRRGGQHHGRLFQFAAQHRQIARLIADAFVLFVRAVMFFIDDDQAQILKRQKQRRARSGHNARAAGMHFAIGAAAGFGREVGMPFGREHAEAFFKARHHRLGQRDFRQHHQNLRVRIGLQSGGDRLHIDFRLARACDAVEQDGFKFSAAHGGAEHVGGCALLRRQNCRRARHVRDRERAVLRNLDERQRAFLHQPRDYAGGHAGAARQFGGGLGAFSGARRLDHLLPRFRHFGRDVIGGDQRRIDRRRLQRRRGAQHHAQQFARIGDDIFRAQFDEFAQWRGERRTIELVRQRFHLAGFAFEIGDGPHYAQALVRPQGRDDDVALDDVHVLRDEVVEGLGQGQWEENFGATHDSNVGVYILAANVTIWRRARFSLVLERRSGAHAGKRGGFSCRLFAPSSSIH